MSDLIRREDVLEIMSKDQWYFIKPREQIERIKAIPPAKPMIGRWIDDEEYNTEYGYYFANCSECGYQINVHENRGYYNYCPNCGAKMEWRT